MVKRPPLKAYVYTFFALLILVISWESNLANAALLSPTIPEESIRIRILANSDSAADQWIKKEVQQAIVASIHTWDQSFDGIEEARLEVKKHLPELNRLVGDLLKQYSFPYGYQVELGKVDFPAKVFGKETYPAGEYEALRVTLGDGRGENWWCVLFPPLCFGVGAVKEKAVGPDELVEMTTQAAAYDETDLEQMSNEDEQDSEQPAYETMASDKEEVEVRFFLGDLVNQIGSSIKGLFS